MLTVLFIVSILLGIVLGTARYASERSRVARAKNDLQVLSNALIKYNVVFGDYPDVDDAKALVAFSRDKLGSAGKEQYRFANLLPQGFNGIDPWGQIYKYRRNKPVDEVDDDYTFTLSSFGPDGEEGTTDDIAAM